VEQPVFRQQINDRILIGWKRKSKLGDPPVPRYEPQKSSAHRNPSFSRYEHNLNRHKAYRVFW
jgi:hypothetical protein